MKEEQKDVFSQLPADFFTQFKSGAEFQGFMDALFKKGVESLLEAELDNHLGYQKHEKAAAGNSRNGKTEKTIKTTKGTYRIEVPRDRQGSFSPSVVPKRKRMTMITLKMWSSPSMPKA